MVGKIDFFEVGVLTFLKLQSIIGLCINEKLRIELEILMKLLRY